MKKMNVGHKVCLIGKIKGLAEESKRTRKRMRKAETEKQLFLLHRLKSDIRISTRHHALAYAYLRDIPYKTVERKCNDKPNVEMIFKIISQHSYLSLASIKEHVSKIQEWIGA